MQAKRIMLEGAVCRVLIGNTLAPLIQSVTLNTSKTKRELYKACDEG
jgi:hypothetical protein